VRNFTFYDRFGYNTIARAFNSSADDAYPTFSPLTGEFYFCSNREGNFDIFRLAIPDLPNVINFISNADNAAKVRKDTSLSGSSNDKFPFISDNVMVFASDRPGGFGGYDLYYSVLKDSIWSTPVNMGPKINTEFDECRPIIIQRTVFKTVLSFFPRIVPEGMEDLISIMPESQTLRLVW